MGKLASVVPIQTTKYLISRNPPVCIFFIDSISMFYVSNSFIHFLHLVIFTFLIFFTTFIISANCVFLGFYKRFTHFLFKDLYHTYKIVFKVFFLWFSHAGMLRACSGRIAGLIIGLGADFWFCLCWVGVFFLGFCLLSGFWDSVMALCCPFFCFAQLMCSQGMPGDIGG